jgi:hypothetical protein
MGKSFLKEVKCKQCEKVFIKRITLDMTRHYCSIGCRNLDKESFKPTWTPERRAAYSAMNKGVNNPNYGKKWTDEQKLAGSELKKQQFAENPEYRHKAGNSNRGKKFSADRIKRMHAHRDPKCYSHPHSAESKKVIGQKSKEKWTPKFKEEFRKTMEANGHWVPKSQLSEYKVYYKEANWIERMIDFFDEQSIDNLNKYGIFSKNNTKGFVRDHIVPRKIGFEFNLPPYILRHPANVQFISHAKNIAKGFSDRKLTLSEKELIINLLFERILNFKKSWREHDLCVNFIKERRVV